MHISAQNVDGYCRVLVQRFLQERDTLRKNMANKDVLTDNRTNDMCVWLYVSFGKFLDYALHIGAIDPKQFFDYSQEMLKIFLSILEQQAERVSELDDTKRFFRGLQVLLETKEVKLEKLQPRNNSFSSNDSRSAIGFLKKEFVYLKNDVAFQQVAAYYRRFGKEFSVSEAALRKTFWDCGYILSQGKKSCIHRLYVNHETYQCIQFEKNTFYRLLNGGKQNGAEGNREIPSDWGMYQNANNFLGR